MDCSVGMIKDQELKHVTHCTDLSTSNQPETRKTDWQNETIKILSTVREPTSVMEAVGLILI